VESLLLLCTLCVLISWLHSPLFPLLVLLQDLLAIFHIGQDLQVLCECGFECF